MKNINCIKGTFDILPETSEIWREVESAVHDFMYVHGFGEIRTPAFEKTELFVRGIGDTTDIVNKEMYTWTDTDKAGTQLTLKTRTYCPSS